MTEYAIRDLAAAAGVTSRTLRHYEQVGILAPSRIGANGYRFYGETEVATLYRILSLRELGMPLSAIRAVLDDIADLGTVMSEHRKQLVRQRDQYTARINAIDTALAKLNQGETMTIEETFASIDPAAFESEVRDRWGDAAWEASADRRNQLSDQEAQDDLARSIDINAQLCAFADAGTKPEAPEFQQLITAHHAWVQDQWGSQPLTNDAYLGLAEMYVNDHRFAQVYGGTANATIIKDAIKHWTTTNQ